MSGPRVGTEIVVDRLTFSVPRATPTCRLVKVNLSFGKIPVAVGKPGSQSFMADAQIHLQSLATACPLCEATAFFASTEQLASDDVIRCAGCGGRYTHGFLVRRMTRGNGDKYPDTAATGATDEKPSQDVSAKADRPRSEPALSTEHLVQEIARAAYFRAQNRGFAPGHEKQDWFEAQSTVLRTRQGGKAIGNEESRAPEGYSGTR